MINGLCLGDTLAAEHWPHYFLPPYIILHLTSLPPPPSPPTWSPSDLIIHISSRFFALSSLFFFPFFVHHIPLFSFTLICSFPYMFFTPPLPLLLFVSFLFRVVSSSSFLTTFFSLISPYIGFTVSLTSFYIFILSSF